MPYTVDETINLSLWFGLDLERFFGIMQLVWSDANFERRAALWKDYDTKRMSQMSKPNCTRSALDAPVAGPFNSANLSVSKRS